MSGDVFSFPSSVKTLYFSSPRTSNKPNPKPNPSSKKRRNLPGTPDPDAEVIALSPKSLMATNRFVCERSATKRFSKGIKFATSRRGHNLHEAKARNKLRTSEEESVHMSRKDMYSS
ncbi:hypothetical protein HAX54_031425 [Datura stramonium]|uniref:Uncharacterized protein n=1 Tax=Datura stramonium TaxID=4076 RepID=A0ABS8VA84_DATST|nr:hypothetical protein [Datura stramonium]